MAEVIYVDASALLRIVFEEPGRRAPIHDAAVVASSSLVEVELFRALDRAHRLRHLGDVARMRKTVEIKSLLRGIVRFPLSDEVIEYASESFTPAISVGEAVHLATAQIVAIEATEFEFWTHSPEQAAAAMTRRFTVRGLNLGRH